MIMVAQIASDELCQSISMINSKYVTTRKGSGDHKAKRGKEEKNLSPRNRKACHNITAIALPCSMQNGGCYTGKCNKY
jgi:hypothetical protein